VDGLDGLPPEVQEALRRICGDDQELERKRSDDAVFWRWMVTGMRGRLIRFNGGPIEVVNCDPKHDGELLVTDIRLR
jgi:hypothetical protein